MGLFTVVGCAIVGAGMLASAFSKKIQATPILVGVGFILLDLSGIL